MANIIGISAYFHDSVCCLLKDGALVAVAQKERFSRKKRDDALPRAAFRYCLEEGGLTTADIDCGGYYEDPALKLERQLWMTLPDLMKARTRELWWKTRQPEREVRETLGYDGSLQFFIRHQAEDRDILPRGYDSSRIVRGDLARRSIFPGACATRATLCL